MLLFVQDTEDQVRLGMGWTDAGESAGALAGLASESGDSSARHRQCCGITKPMSELVNCGVKLTGTVVLLHLDSYET